MINMLVIWNTLVFFLYGYDKNQSRKRGRRISENCLMGFAALLGGIGAFAGMIVFHHKTRKIKFKILVPVFAVIELMIILFIYK